MSARFPTLTTLAVATFAALAAGACGGDDSGDGAESITKAEYVERANTICADSAQLADVAYKHVFGNGGPTPVGSQAFVVSAAQIIASGVERRAAIPAPEGDEETVAAINAAGEGAAAEFEDAASSKEAATALMRGQTPDPAAEYDRLSDEYGLTQCAGVD